MKPSMFLLKYSLLKILHFKTTALSLPKNIAPRWLTLVFDLSKTWGLLSQNHHSTRRQTNRNIKQLRFTKLETQYNAVVEMHDSQSFKFRTSNLCAPLQNCYNLYFFLLHLDTWVPALEMSSCVRLLSLQLLPMLMSAVSLFRWLCQIFFNTPHSPLSCYKSTLSSIICLKPTKNSSATSL